jgi:TfoX/Sxy family transcriptional regulator of competence genes
MPRDHGPTAERIRTLLAGQPSTREVTMFGGLSFMVNDKMIVNVRSSGDLLVRVDPRRPPDLIVDHGARPAQMGPGRAMGPSWLDVPAELLSDDDRLRFWVDVAMRFNAQATAHPGRRSRTSARRPSDSRG